MPSGLRASLFFLLLSGCSSALQVQVPEAAPPSRGEREEAPAIPPSRGERVEAPAAPPRVEAPAAPETPESITMDVKDMDLAEALKVISRKAGLNIVADPDVREKVTVQLDRVHWRVALEVMARQAKCKVVVESERLIRLTQPPSITMEFQDADIKVLLQLLAKQAGVNIVYGSDIQGKITLNLKEVPWMEALEAVVKTAGYVIVREGDYPSPTSWCVMRP